MDEQGTVKTLEKALFIMDLFLSQREELSIAEIHRELNMSKPTVFRLTKVLESFGYLVKRENNKYWLGSKILQLSMVINEKLELCALAMPIIKNLRDTTGETAHLNVPENFERVCIYCLHGKEEVRAMMQVGQRSPLHVGASAKVLLAYRSDACISKYIKQYQLSDASFGPIYANRLWDDVRKIREQGHCITDRERTKDGIGVSAPVRDVSGSVVAAVAVTVPATRDKVAIDRYRELVNQAAKEISIQLGFLPD